MKKIFAFILILSLAFTMSCSNRTDTRESVINDKQKQTSSSILIDTLPKELEEALANPKIDNETKNIIEQSRKRNLPKSSIEKIYKDLEDKKITEEEAVVLSFISTFSPKELKEQYQKDTGTIERIDLDMQSAWLIANFDKMSEENKKKMQPYILPPNDPNSAYYENPRKKPLNPLAFIFSATVAYAEDEEFPPLIYNAPNRQRAVIISYKKDNGTEQENIELERRANLVLSAIEKAYPMLKDLLEIEPAPINLFIKELVPNLYGRAAPALHNEICIISINKGLSDKLTQSVTVHELFHAFQFSMSDRYRKSFTDTRWLQEATATWSSHYVYPDNNVEHEYLEGFFGTLEKKRINFNGGFEYSSHMLIYFLVQYRGDPKIVHKLLDLCKYGEVDKWLPYSIEHFPRVYSEFASYNWDREPFEAYQDVPSFPHMGARGECLEIYVHQDRKKTNIKTIIDAGACSYDYHDFVGEDIENIEFDFSGLGNNVDLRRQALIKINGVWSREDWSDINKKKFCRNKPEENIEKVVIVQSYANLMEMYLGNYEVDTRGECKQVPGYTKITASYNDPPYTFTFSYISNDEIEFDKDRKYIDDEGSDEYAQPEFYVLRTRNSTLHSLSVGEFSTDKGDGTLNETYALKDGPVKIEIFPEVKEGKIYLNPDKKNKNWCTYELKTPFGNKTEKVDIKSLGFQNLIELDASDFTKDGIKGTREYEFLVPGTNGKANMKLEFNYKFKKASK